MRFAHMVESPIRPTGIVLAGGQSRRMGKDKATLSYGPHSWIDQMIQTLQAVPCEQIWISGDRPAGTHPCIPDRVTGLGPLGGLASVIPHSASTHLVIVPVDMPQLIPDLLRMLLTSVGDADAAIFRNHPLPFVCKITNRLTETLDSLCAPQVPSRHRSFQTLSRCLQTQEILLSHTFEQNLRNFNTPEDLMELAA
jgi:molybdopterin-guanine dinucleotide biosynthesis protein A